MEGVKDEGKRNVLGVLVDAVDYEAAVDKIVTAARAGAGFSVSALAVHGVMTGVGDPGQRYRLNHLDLVTPDGQPVRWALNLLHRTSLSDRVYGPTLTLEVCRAAAGEGLPVYFYGSREAVLERLEVRLRELFPDLIVAGRQPSLFRRTTGSERDRIVERIRASGARITFVGLGCPRQEVFAYEYRDALSMPVLAVGAAFDYLAGLLKEPPALMQRVGLQWLYRLLQDPRRLWRRYVLLNSAYLALLCLQALKLWRPDPVASQAPVGEILYG
ncbi:MAG: WecB/TagA/CpsF family glycosyltransferase [Actinomycetota bacterium]|nr:WecB/TagA/CpsF family glycosyltransferase [Actinomycetota bacterium]